MKDSIAISVLLLTFRSFLSSAGIEGNELHFIFSSAAGFSAPWQFVVLTGFYSVTGYFLYRCFWWSGDFLLRLGFFASLFFLLEVLLLWLTPLSWDAFLILGWFEKAFFGATVFLFATYRQQENHVVIKNVSIKTRKIQKCQQADRSP